MPLYDLSGTNPRGDFCAYELPALVKKNLEKFHEQKKQNNIHKLEGDSLVAKHEDVDMEEGETLSDDEDSVDSPGPQEDTMKLYDRFWKLQQYLHQPNQLYDKNNWISFRTIVDTVILHLEHKPTTCEVWNLSNSFMTEPKAFALQLNDVNFRRCLLVQILIAIQYLDIPVESKQNTMILEKNQVSWMESTTARIFGVLSKTPDDEKGRHFCRLVTQVLQFERSWNFWKNDKCQEPKPPEVKPDDEMINMGITYHKRRKMSDELKCAKPYNLYVIGSQEMSRLWNKRPHQPNPPDVSKYFNGPLEKQMENFKNPNNSFRVLRLLRKNPYFFQPTKEAVKSLEDYLKGLSEKHFNN